MCRAFEFRPVNPHQGSREPRPVEIVISSNCLEETRHQSNTYGKAKPRK